MADWLRSHIGIGPDVAGKLLASALVVLVFWAARRALLSITRRRVTDPVVRYRWQKITSYLLPPIALLIIGRIWFEAVGSIATFLGLLTAGVAIALKDPLLNMVGWIFVLWRRPFEIGDRVEIGGIAGDVIDIRLFQFTVLEIGNWVHADQSTGRVVHIPNGKVITEALANSDRGFRFIWNEIPVLVTFESNWEQAKGLLQAIADRHVGDAPAVAARDLQDISQRYLIVSSSLTPQVYTTTVDSGILLTIRYLCAPRERRQSTATVWEEILRAFAQHDDIDLAYATYRVTGVPTDMSGPSTKERPS